LNPIQNVKYDLKGLIIHEGNPLFGHYTSFVKIDGNWFSFNDVNVKKVSTSQVFDEALGDGK